MRHIRALTSSPKPLELYSPAVRILSNLNSLCTMFIPPQVLRKQVPKKRKQASALESPPQTSQEARPETVEKSAGDAITSPTPRTAGVIAKSPLEESIPLPKSPSNPLANSLGVVLVGGALRSTRDHVSMQANPHAQHDSPSIKKTFSADPRLTPEYLETFVCGLELAFTDYAFRDKELSEWIKKHERVVDGEGGCKCRSLCLLNYNAIAGKH
jgi:hypothetical protein